MSAASSQSFEQEDRKEREEEKQRPDRLVFLPTFPIFLFNQPGVSGLDSNFYPPMDPHLGLSFVSFVCFVGSHP
ncbi:MAG: hypothetical protein V4773_22300 [Verrucomicrobiota bacterium]